tara:strand:- start:1230 stop:1868 length:639 start_codon:yes stop_codon:yes gene_type:complete
MGYFSFLCAETGNSIGIDKEATIHMPTQSITSYPYVDPILHEDKNWRHGFTDEPSNSWSYTGIYDGYGRINHYDVYVILYMINDEALAVSSYNEGNEVANLQEARAIGLAIDMGSYYQDKDGNNYHCSMHSDPNKLGVKSTAFKGNYDTVTSCYLTTQEASGKTPNQLIGDGDWVKKKIIPHIPFPLKITRSECELGYFHLPASEDCPNQGF